MKVKPKEQIVRVKDNIKVKKDVFLLSFVNSYISKAAYPGQFLHIKVKKTILRRPLSIHKIEGNTVSIIFRVRGRGTKFLSEYKKANQLDVLGPLGKGFSFGEDKIKGAQNLLIAGGLGLAPLMFLAQKIKKYKPVAILGEKTKNQILCEKEFKSLGAKVIICTDDGSKGIKGSAIEGLKSIKPANKMNIFSCGPKEMFKAINQVMKKIKTKADCEVSFEQFMGCGLGICCGCTIETKNGYKKVCKDGPVFDIGDIF